MLHDIRLIKSFRELYNTYRPNRYKIVPYLIRDGKTHPVAFVCPGGAYHRVCDFVEGYPYAKKLNAMGYHAIVVFYRVREKALFPNPQDDLGRAIGEAMLMVEKWKLDLEGYSIWGSSAGGHLVASFGTDSMGYPNYNLPKPAALILTYPVVTMGKKTHFQSRDHHMGVTPTAEAIRARSVEQQITPNYPPTFLWWGDEDDVVHPDNSRMLRDALEKNGIPCEWHEYPGISHGVGIAQGLICEDWFKKAVAFWETHR